MESGGWTDFYYSNDKAICGARTVHGQTVAGDVAGLAALEVKFCFFIPNQFSVTSLTLSADYVVDMTSSLIIPNPIIDLDPSRCVAVYTFDNLPTEATGDTETGIITVDTTDLIYRTNIIVTVKVEGRSYY